MIEKLLNEYVRIEPIHHETFIASEKETYEEIGIVIAKDDNISNIPIGSKVYFDSFMAKKYPIDGQDGKFQWYIHYDEIVKIEYEDKEVSK